MTHDFTTITGAQAAINTLPRLLEDKGVVKPRVRIDISANETPSIWVTASDDGVNLGDHNYQLFTGLCVEDCFAKCMAYIDAMRDPVDIHLEAYTRRLADATDRARADGVNEDYIKPVSDTIKAMSDNLLAAPKGDGQ